MDENRRSSKTKKLPSGLNSEQARETILHLLDTIHRWEPFENLCNDLRGVDHAESSEAATTILVVLRRTIVYYLNLARAGHTALISELPIYARQLVEATNELADKHPDLMARVASDEIDWPIMASYNYPKDSDFKKLADRIRLGTKTIVSLSPRKKFKPHTPLNRFLLHLLGGTLSTKTEFYFLQLPENLPKLTKESIPYFLDELIMPVIDRLKNTEGSWDGVPELVSITKNIPYEPEHRSAIRNRIKRALKAMSGD